jgi:single-strand DNA-binding protein
MNQATFIGNLTKTAETKQVNGGNPFTTFSLAVNRKWKTKDGTKREDVQYIDCIMNGNISAITPYLTKGTKVCVTGRVSCHAWIDNKGQAIAGLDLNVRDLELLGGKQDIQQPTQQQAAFIPPSQQGAQPQQTVLSQEFVGGNNLYGGGNDDLPF